MPARRSPAKSAPKGLSFPAQVSILTAATFLAVALAIYVFQFGQRADIWDIRTQIEIQTKLQEERAAQIKEAVASMQRRQELQQYEIQALKEVVMKLQPGKP